MDLSIKNLETSIYMLRDHKVMLSQDLAELYNVEPRVLIQAVKRNMNRFPEDFIFQLTKDEFENLKSQNVTSSWGGIRRATPYAFTEQGVAMLSSLLRSERAVQVNIEIMRTFVKLRKALSTNNDMENKLRALETKYDEHFRVVFDAIRELMTPSEKVDTAQRSIGFKGEENT